MLKKNNPKDYSAVLIYLLHKKNGNFFLLLADVQLLTEIKKKDESIIIIYPFFYSGSDDFTLLQMGTPTPQSELCCQMLNLKFRFLQKVTIYLDLHPDTVVPILSGHPFCYGKSGLIRGWPLLKVKI